MSSSVEIGDTSALIVRMSYYEIGSPHYSMRPAQHPLASPIAMPFHEHLPQKAYPEASDNFKSKMEMTKRWFRGNFWIPSVSD